MNLDELYQHGQEAAKHLFDKQGKLTPMWLCVDDKGELIPICVPMTERETRDALADVLRKILKEMKTVRYVSMVEAWALKGKTEDGIPESVRQGASISSHPDRMEVIYIIAEDIDGQTRSGMYHILRPERGKAVLSPYEDYGDNQHEGRFTNLLSPPSSCLN